jgi:ribosome-binding factor A
MPGRRVERLNEQVKREVADILRTKVKDPRVGTVSVTGARVSRDLSVATIYVLPSGDAQAQRQTLEGLSAAAPYVRNEIGERLRLRKLPELRFLRDTSLEHANRIEQLLHELRPPASNGPESEPDED